jgi:hypothetical protein
VVGEIEMPEAEPGEPFIFSISEDFKICDLYLPNKDLAEVSSTYYNCLAEKYK